MTRDIWACIGAYFFIGTVFAAFIYNYTRNIIGTSIVFFLWPIAVLTIAVVAIAGP